MGTLIKIPTGKTLPIVASPRELAEVLGGKGERSYRDDCEAGAIPTLPRGNGEGGHWRIPVAKHLDTIGMPYEFVPASAESA